MIGRSPAHESKGRGAKLDGPMTAQHEIKCKESEGDMWLKASHGVRLQHSQTFSNWRANVLKASSLTQQEARGVAGEAPVVPRAGAAQAERVAAQALALGVRVRVLGAAAVPHAAARVVVQAPVDIAAQAGGGVCAGEAGLCARWGETFTICIV